HTPRLEQTQCALISTSCPSMQVEPLGQATLISNEVMGRVPWSVVVITPLSNTGNTKTLPGRSESFSAVAANGVATTMVSRQKTNSHFLLHLMLNLHLGLMYGSRDSLLVGFQSRPRQEH